MNLKDYIRDIPDWPKKGILFRDITPLLANRKAFADAVNLMAEPYKDCAIDYVSAVEARGFIFGTALAEKLGAGFIPIRKKGKLPYKTESITYGLEYGSDTIEVHADAVSSGGRILMVDDLLATGGTMSAACELLEKLGGSIEGISFLIELSALSGRAKLKDKKISVVIEY